MLPSAPVTIVFFAAAFLNAFLLFLVQPIISKFLLPGLGGSFYGWNGASLFIQLVSLVGVVYAHVSVRLLGVRRQVAAHLPLLTLPACLWGMGLTGIVGGVLPHDLDSSSGSTNGLAALIAVACLAPVIGLPVFFLSAGIPLLLRWFAATGEGKERDPYFLYAIATLGSLTSLLLYPVLIEPQMQLRQQSNLWILGCGMTGVLTICCALLGLRGAHRAESVCADPGIERVRVSTSPHSLWFAGTSRRLRWSLLAAIPVSLLLGATTCVSTEISPIPLFWIAPLALYLFALVVSFTRQRFWMRLSPIVRATAQALCILAFLALLCLLPEEPPPDFWILPPTLSAWFSVALVGATLLLPQPWLFVVQPLVTMLLLYHLLAGATAEVEGLLLHLFGVYVVSRACFGELARDRPPPSDVTAFFLWLTLGGFVGALFNGLIAPLLFSSVVEYWLVLILALLFRPGNAPYGAMDAVLVYLVSMVIRRSERANSTLQNTLTRVFDLLMPVVIWLLSLLWVIQVPHPLPPGVLFGPPLLLCLLTLARRLRVTLATGAILLSFLPLVGSEFVTAPTSGWPWERPMHWMLAALPSAFLGLPLLGLLLVALDLGARRAATRRTPAVTEPDAGIG